MVADLFIGVAMMERSVALDPTLEHWSGTIALGAYHARPAGEMDQAKQLFESALDHTGRKNLQVQLNYATSYACLKGDRAQYETLLTEVLSATDPDPEQRLVNLLAKRRARRALTRQHMLDCGFDMSNHARPAAPPPLPAPAAAAPGLPGVPLPVMPTAPNAPSKPAPASSPSPATPPKH
jgi:hypothetical protein